MSNQRRSLKRIVAAEKRGEIAVVVELCLGHLKRYPDDQYALIWYAMVKTKLYQCTQAEKALRKSISLFSEDKVGLRLASVQMGDLFREKGDLKRASLWYRRGLRADPKYGNGYNFLGLVAFQSGLLKQAELCYRKAIKLRAQSLDESYYNLGCIMLARRRYQEAIQHFRKSIEIDPKYTIAKKRLKDADLALRLKCS